MEPSRVKLAKQVKVSVTTATTGRYGNREGAVAFRDSLYLVKFNYSNSETPFYFAPTVHINTNVAFNLNILHSIE